MSSNRPRYSIIVPVHNEAAAVASVIDSLLKEADRDTTLEAEVILVDDGSTDATSVALSAIRDPRVRILSLPRRQGMGSAIRQAAPLIRGSLVGWIDGDGSYRSEDLFRVLRACGSGNLDQAIGCRPTGRGHQNWLRWLVKRAICTGVGLWWRRRIPDLNSGLRAFSERSFCELVEYLPHGFSCSTTATLRAINARHRLVFEPVAYDQRTSGSRSKFRPLVDTWRLLRVVWRHCPGKLMMDGLEERVD